MTFAVPASKKSKKQNRFEFEHEGEKYDLPLMKYVSAGAIEAFEGGKDMTGLILAADNERTRDAIRSLDGEQMKALMDALMEASGVTVGESGASSDS